jgi:hypothetical protein
MIPLLVPIGLGLIGGYLSQDSTEKFAGGGGVEDNSKLLKQGDRVYFKLKNKKETFDVYDIATRAEIEEAEEEDSEIELGDLPINWGLLQGDYAQVDLSSKSKKAFHPTDLKGNSTDATLESITDEYYVFIIGGDFTDKYIIIPKKSIEIDWEKTYEQINKYKNSIRLRKKEIKEGTFTFNRGWYDSDNRFHYNKNKFAKGGNL